MTRRSLLMVLSALPLALALPVEARDDRRTIDWLYQHVARLLEQKDIDSVVKMTTKDVVLLGPGGAKMTRDQWQAQMRQFFATATGVKMRVKLLNCKVEGDVASVTSRQELTATIPDKDGKSHNLKAVDISRDTLARSGKTWLLKRSETIKHEELLDGKPVPPPAKG